MKNIKLIIPIVLLMFLFNCKKDKLIERYYPNGSLKELYYLNKDSLKEGKNIIFYKNGKRKEERLYNRGNIIDTIKYFNEEGLLVNGTFNIGDSTYLFAIKEGVIIKEGMFDKKSKTDINKFNGWIKYYNNGILNKKIDYKDIYGKSNNYNRYFEYKKDGKTIDKENSFYFDMNLPDTLSVNQIYSFEIPFHSNADRTIGFFSVTSTNITDRFKNLQNLKLDTTYNSKIPLIKFKSDEMGLKKIRAKITEQYLTTIENKKDTTMLDVSIHYRDFYIEKSIFFIENKKINPPAPASL